MANRCTKPSTQVSGGGYLEVYCACDEHAALNPEYDWRPLKPDEGLLDTYVGMKRDRRRCQHEEKK